MKILFVASWEDAPLFFVESRETPFVCRCGCESPGRNDKSLAFVGRAGARKRNCAEIFTALSITSSPCLGDTTNHEKGRRWPDCWVASGRAISRHEDRPSLERLWTIMRWLSMSSTFKWINSARRIPVPYRVISIV